MVKLNKLEISDFRGIKSLKLDTLGKINVFLGDNNVGKTSILETIFMLTGMSNPMIPTKMNLFREEKLVDTSYLKYYFYNTNLRCKPTIVGFFEEDETRSVELTPDLGVSTKLGEDSSMRYDTSTEVADIIGLNIRFKRGKTSYLGKVVREMDKLAYKAEYNFLENIKSVFIPSSVKEGSVMDSFAELVKRQKKGEVIQLMQLFDYHIENIEYLSDGIYLQYKGMNELFPLALAGDGTRRFFNIVSFVADPTTNIVLIDEIETGLHHKAYLELWKSLLNFVSKTNVQLFITTHSRETLIYLSEAYRTNENIASKDISIFSLVQNRGVGVDAYSITAKGLESAIDNHIELR